MATMATQTTQNDKMLEHDVWQRFCPQGSNCKGFENAAILPSERGLEKAQGGNGSASSSGPFGAAIVLREVEPLEHGSLPDCVLLEDQGGLGTQRVLEDRQLSLGIAANSLLQRFHDRQPGVRLRAAFGEVLPQSG